MSRRPPAIIIGISLCLSVWAGGLAGSYGQTQPGPSREVRLSLHNRLLLNRVVLSRLPTITVMLAVGSSALPVVAAHVERLAGQTLRSDETVGYLRVEVPTERFFDLVAHERIDAYQISSFSQGVWYRDGPPQRNAEMYRGFEVQPPPIPRTSTAPLLPALSPAQARDVGYTAGQDVGVAAWLEAHPNADGRGVTIALLESALAGFDHPTVRSAQALDGRELKKIVGILNTIDPTSPDATRVELTVSVRAATAWARLGRRTFILPRPGVYRFGRFSLPAGGNLVQDFGVLAEEHTGELWVDANGNADFSDEKPMSDVNDRIDVRRLTLAHPAKGEIGFVVSRGH